MSPARRRPLRLRILDKLAGGREVSGPSLWRELIFDGRGSANPDSVRKLLVEMRGEGLLTRDGEGIPHHPFVYRLIDVGEAD